MTRILRVVAVALLAVMALTGIFVSSEASPATSHSRLIVADLRGHALLVLDTPSFEVARRIELPGGPHELLELPDGRVLVSIEQRGMLVAANIDTGSTEVIDVDGVPHGLALHDDVLLVTDRSVNRIRRFRLPGWHELDPIRTGTWPHAVRVTPGGDIAVATAVAGRLEVGGSHYDVGRTTETLDVRADGAIAVAAATDGVVDVYSDSGVPLGRWILEGRPVRVLFSPDGATLAVALSARGAVAIIDATAPRIVSVGGVPDGLAFSPDGTLVYVSDVYGGAIAVVDLATSNVRIVGGVGEATGALLPFHR